MPRCHGPAGTYRLRSAFFALSGCLALLAACSSSSEHAAKPTALTPIAAPIDVRAAWTVDLGDSQGTFLRPCVLEHAIFAASRKGNLVRVDPSSGKELWRIPVDGGITAGVGSDGLTVAVAGPRGNVVAFDAEGKQLWQAQAPSDVIAPPLVGHDLVLVRSTDQRITAYEGATGKRRWVFQKQQPSLTLRVEADLVFAGDSVLVGFPGGRLGAVALSNGAARWEAGVSEPKGATEVERLADVLGVPGLTDNDVCTASYQGRIGCFDARNGDLRWAREFSAGTGVAVSADGVYGIDTSSHVNGFKRSSGAGLWQTAALANRGLSAPVVVGKLLAVGDFEGKIHFLSLDDGKLVGRFDASAGPVISTPQVWNGAAVFQTARGRLFLLTTAGE
ncbi:Outer membrane protein assembly factor BamB [Burkholderiales bacterium]|nr:Outer membrane protein assembly factor BamB [Burkholderiales bacterium]